jgi:hypothetical protein
MKPKLELLLYINSAIDNTIYLSLEIKRLKTFYKIGYNLGKVKQRV